MKDNAVIIVVFNPVMPDRPANRSSAAPESSRPAKPDARQKERDGR